MNSTEMKPQHENVSSTFSLNDNFTFMGKELHVQTENVSSEKPCIRTHVFFHGRVIYSKKWEYENNTLETADFGRIRDMMQTQHQSVLGKIAEQYTKRQKQP
jgi:hypothetical protein